MTTIGCRLAGVVAATVSALGVVGWSGDSGAAVDAAAATPLATSLISASGTWATLPMGHLAQPLNTFWQLLYRPAGSATWSDRVKAVAAATNGGLVLAGAPGQQPFVVAVRPTNLLHFSPLVTTADGGGSWSSGIIPSGLADEPGSLAVSAAGGAFALVGSGQGASVLASRGTLSTWTTLVTERQLARTDAGRACGLRSLTAVTSVGTRAVVGATCTRPGRVGIFTQVGHTWQLDGPLLPGTMRQGGPEVLSVRTTPYGVTTLFKISGSSGVSLVTAWGAGAQWSISPPLALSAGEHLISFGPANGIGMFVLTSTPSGAERLAMTEGASTGWAYLTPPPSRTGTVAFEETASSSVDALAASGTSLSVWSLAPGAIQWVKRQTIHVPIDYGSSG